MRHKPFQTANFLTAQGDWLRRLEFLGTIPPVWSASRAAGGVKRLFRGVLARKSVTRTRRNRLSWPSDRRVPGGLPPTGVGGRSASRGWPTTLQSHLTMASAPRRSRKIWSTMFIVNTSSGAAPSHLTPESPGRDVRQPAMATIHTRPLCDHLPASPPWQPAAHHTSHHCSTSAHLCSPLRGHF